MTATIMFFGFIYFLPLLLGWALTFYFAFDDGGEVSRAEFLGMLVLSSAPLLNLIVFYAVMDTFGPWLRGTALIKGIINWFNKPVRSKR